MTHKAANRLTKAKSLDQLKVQVHTVLQEEGFRIHVTRGELYNKYIMQAKTALHKSKSPQKEKEILPAFVCFTPQRRKVAFHPPVLLRHNPAAELTDLIFTWPDFIKKIKFNKSFFCWSPLVSGSFFFVCW